MHPTCQQVWDGWHGAWGRSPCTDAAAAFACTASAQVMGPHQAPLVMGARPRLKQATVHSPCHSCSCSPVLAATWQYKAGQCLCRQVTGPLCLLSSLLVDRSRWQQQWVVCAACCPKACHEAVCMGSIAPYRAGPLHCHRSGRCDRRHLSIHCNCAPERGALLWAFTCVARQHMGIIVHVAAHGCTAPCSCSIKHMVI